MGTHCVFCGRFMLKPESILDMSLEIAATGEVVDVTFALCNPQVDHDDSWVKNYDTESSCYEKVTSYNTEFAHGIKKHGVVKSKVSVNGSTSI